MVKQGYKQTEIGVIPEDWEVKELQQIGSFSKGKGISKSESNSGDIPAVRYGELYTKHHNVIKKIYSFIKKDVAVNSVRLGKGNILFAGSGETKEEIGKSAVFIDDFEAYVGGDIVVFKPNQNYSSVFLGYLSNVSFIQKQKAANGQGDAVVHIYANNLKSIQIPLPPLPEQEAIAEALSDADAWIESLEQLIAKKRLIKQGAMQELLTPKEDWEVKKLGEVCEIFGRIGFRGYTVKDIVSENQGAITLGPSNMRGGKIVGPNYTYISWEKYYESPEIMLAEGDIVLVKTASVGRIALIKDLNIKMTINPQLVVFKKIKCNSVLLSYYMQTEDFQNQIKSKLGGGVLATLTQEEIKQFQVILPSLPEQERIATILSDMDAELEALEQKLSKARQIKQGMMQELLTGRVRLVS